MNRFSAFLQRRRGLLLCCAGILLVYTALGFLFVPWLAERQLVTLMDERLDVQARVEAIRFNPFTFTFEVEELHLDEADSATLLSLPRLFVNFEPSRLFLARLRFDEIAIDDLSLHLERYSPSENTLSRLADRWAATADPDKEAAEETEETVEEAEEESEGSLFALEIGTFSFSEGSLSYVDQVPEAGFETTISPITVVVNDFSTREARVTNTGIEIKLEQDAVLTWDGNMSLSPLQASGSLALNNFPLSLPWRYLQDQLPLTVQEGRFAFDLEYNLDYANETLDLDISNINAALSALDVRENGVEEAFLAGGTIALANGSVAIPENRVQLESLSLDDFSLSAERNESGQLNWLAMLEALPETSPEPEDESIPEEDVGNPWQVGISSVLLNDTTFSLTDRVPEQDGTISLTLDAMAEGLDNQPETVIPYNVAIAIASGGTIDLEGEMQVLPAFSTDAELSIAELSLQVAQAWLDDYAHVDIEEGALAMSASLSSTPQEPLSYRGSMSLSALALNDRGAGSTLASLDNLSVNNVALSLADNSLAISEVVIDAPYARVAIDEDGSTNVGRVLRSQEPAVNGADPADSETVESTEIAEVAEDSESEALPMAISLGEVQLNNFSSDFTDRTLPIVFDTSMHSLNGRISGFDSNSAEPMRIDLEGQVDEFGLVQVGGNINPLHFESLTDIDLSFSNLDMPAMSPYVIKFAGRQIEDGRADVDLSYEITDGALMASNVVVLRDLRLGERVEHPDAMDLPLDLAVALLKNGQGVIDLEVPVSGDIGDPQFSLGPAIRSAIASAITNVVAAPFRLLGRLVGGSEDSVDSIRFQPGRSVIAPPEQEKLKQLGEALAQRPQLVLEIPPVFASEADQLVLKTQAVEAALEAQLEQDGNADAQLNERRRTALETLYTEAGLSPELEILQMEHTSAATEEAEASFDAPAYRNDLNQRLISAQPFSESQLERLAAERAAAVIAYLSDNTPLEDSQYRSTEAVSSEVDEGGWLTMNFELEAAE